MPYKNKEKRAEADKRYRIKNKEKIKERKKRDYKEYYLKNKEKLSERTLKWRAANKERVKTYTQKYRLTHKEIQRANNQRRGSRNGYREIIINLLKERDGIICKLCDKELIFGKEHIDHIMPLCIGGTHAAENVRLLHDKCNLGRDKKYLDIINKKI